MPKKEEEQVEELSENEEFISRDDLDIEVMSTADEDQEAAVFVKFTGFEDVEEAEEYAEFLASNLPLLLFETTRIQ